MARRGRAAIAAFAIALAGCGGAEKPKARSAADVPPPPKVGEAAPQRAATAAEKADFEQAVADYKKATEKGFDASQCAGLTKAFADLAAKYPKLAEARFNEGAIKERCKDGDGAKKAYLAALSANGGHAPSLAAVGRLAAAAGDEARAMEYFNQAVKADPKSPYGYLGRAMVSRERGRTGSTEAVASAVEDLRRTLAIDSTNMDAYGTLALIIYDHAGDDRAKLDLARLICEQAKKIDANYAPIYNILGLIWLKRDNYTAALAQFKEAVKHDPDLVDTHLNIGAITLNFRDYTTAEKSFREVIRLKPQHVDAWVGLGVALRGQKKSAEAESAYKEAAKVAPDNPAIDYNLGVLYQDYLEQTPDQLQTAQKYYEKYLSRVSKGGKVDDVKQRIKTIQENLKAIEEAKRLAEEAEKMQKEMEQQQKEMERQQKELEKQQPPQTPPAGAPPAAPPAEGAAPPAPPPASPPK
jgi:tetratricopeptide (TPR) repeat protein